MVDQQERGEKMDIFKRVFIYFFHAVLYEKYFSSYYRTAIVQDVLLITECETFMRGRLRLFTVVIYGFGTLFIEFMYFKRFKGRVCAITRNVCYVTVLYAWEFILTWIVRSTGSCTYDYNKRLFDYDRFITEHLPFCIALCFYLEFLIMYVNSIDISFRSMVKDLLTEGRNFYVDFIKPRIYKNANSI